MDPEFGVMRTLNNKSSPFMILDPQLAAPRVLSKYAEPFG
jgi:hypothetical protein